MIRVAPAGIVSGRGMWKLMEMTENVLRSLGQGSAGILVMLGPAVRFCLCPAGAADL